MTPANIALLFGAGTLAGIINTVAGGGSLVTFPTLMSMDLSPVIANATNNTSMWFGTCGTVGGYREEIQNHFRPLLPAILIAFIGGFTGALLLLFTPPSIFHHLVPWLIIAATVIFALGEKLKRVTVTAEHDGTFSKGALFALFLVAIYSGYFGAAGSILVLALLSLSGISDIHRANGIKGIICFVTTGTAIIPFAIANIINWPVALIMAVSTFFGSYYGARITRHLPQKLIRNSIICIGATLSAYYFWSNR